MLFFVCLFFRKVQEMSAWQKSFKEVEREINRFCRTFGGPEVDEKRKEHTHILEHDPQDIALNCKTKLAKTKENINLKLKSVTDVTRYVPRTADSVASFIFADQTTNIQQSHIVLILTMFR